MDLLTLCVVCKSNCHLVLVVQNIASEQLIVYCARLLRFAKPYLFLNLALLKSLVGFVFLIVGEVIRCFWEGIAGSLLRDLVALVNALLHQIVVRISV